MSISVIKSINSESPEKNSRLDGRRSDEIIIGVVAAIGSGASSVSGILSDILIKDYGYTGKIIKASEKIEQNGFRVSDNVDLSQPNRVERLQQIGSALRGKFGADYVINKCVEEINSSRPNVDPAAPPRRHFTIIDSIKNPVEQVRLADIYGGAFWQVGVFAPEGQRERRLKSQYKAEQIARMFEIDQDEGKKYGQKVKSAISKSDYFIRNDSNSFEDLRESVKRFIDLLFRTNVITPSIDEVGMYAAASASMGSACLSRQVGAAIVDSLGNVIAEGRNDVPKAHGGLYGRDSNNDQRCFRVHGGVCHNDMHKSNIINNLTADIQSELSINGDSLDKLKKIISNSGIKSLIEFSRSVHAEMDAILSAARSGVGSQLQGSSLYSTVYPCHNCARHIVAAGVSRVVYIEPYTKSLALDLHDDAISLNETDVDKCVVFLQFEGAAPKNMLRLFEAFDGRKLDGKFQPGDPKESAPASRTLLDGFVLNETLVVAETGELENEA